MVSKVPFFFREAVQGIKNNLLIHLIAAGTITFALVTLGIFMITVINLDRTLNEWGKDLQVIVYLDRASSTQEIARAGEAITRLPQTKKVTFVSKEEALARLKEGLTAQAGLLADLRDNPLPPSFEVELKEEHKHPEAIKLFIGEIKKIAASAEVDYGQEWLQRFSSFIGMLKLVGLCIGSFLLLATIFIISNTIKLTIYSRREEIEIMKLVGATNLSIRIPFFLEGITQGLLASLLAIGILYGGYKALVHKLIVDYSLFLGPLQLTFLPPQLMAALVLLGIALGIFGCAFSMGRFLKV
jgi:cell division transport system permease protein